MNDLRFRRDLLELLGKNIEFVAALAMQIRESARKLFDAGNRMALAMGQDPDAEPLPPVKEFLDQCDANNKLTQEMIATVQLLTRNHEEFLALLRPPVIQ